MTAPILLTGITGFIAKRIALDLLEAGHAVRGSLRSAGRQEEVRAALAAHVSDAAALDRLSFVTLDLADDAGWAEALSGAAALVHTASPFPMVQPKNEDDIIRPAVDGTLRALRAAQGAGVTRVIVTSSVVAIEATDKPQGAAYTEADWSELDHPLSSPYYKSKTLAERAAWDFVAEHPEMQLTTINPTLVLGQPLDANYGTSLQLIERVLSGSDPMLPNIGFGVVDVADVSAAHVAALDRPETAGRRFIACGTSATMPEIAKYLKAKYPDKKIATGVAPKLLLRILSLFDASIKTVMPGLGRIPHYDTSAAEQDLGITFVPWETAVDRASAAVIAKA
ncbi:MAG: aldehyde reductase [Pseudomonadota bacterium]